MDAVTGGLQDKVKKRTAELNPDFPGAPPSAGSWPQAVLTLGSGY